MLFYFLQSVFSDRRSMALSIASESHGKYQCDEK